MSPEPSITLQWSPLHHLGSGYHFPGMLVPCPQLGHLNPMGPKPLIIKGCGWISKGLEVERTHGCSTPQQPPKNPHPGRFVGES